MAISDREVQQAFRTLENRLESIEGTVRRLASQEGKWQTTNVLHPISTNLSNIREMFLLEILRQKGLLDALDLAPITEAVKEKLSGKNVPWGASHKAALENIESVLHEISGDYDWSPEDNDKP